MLSPKYNSFPLYKLWEGSEMVNTVAIASNGLGVSSSRNEWAVHASAILSQALGKPKKPAQFLVCSLCCGVFLGDYNNFRSVFFFHFFKWTQGCLCLHFSKLIFNAFPARWHHVKAKSRTWGSSGPQKQHGHFAILPKLATCLFSFFLIIFQWFYLFCLPQVFHF